MRNGWRPEPSPTCDSTERLFVSTGCTSSDMLLAPVLASLRQRRPRLSISGFGGEPLREHGARLIFDTTPTSSVGVWAGALTLLRHAGQGLRAFRAAAEYFRSTPPGLAILVDNSGLNLRFLKLAQRHGVPVLYYVPPELWSLWKHEIRRVVTGTTVLAPVFASEAAAYAARGGNARWVGHPLVDIVGAFPRPARPANGRITIGLFPGSRRLEVRQLLPILQEAAALLQRELGEVRFLICSANEVTDRLIRNELGSWGVPVELFQRQSLAVIAQCDLLLTCSGTVTLEAALLGVPMVAMYRLHHYLDWAISAGKLYRGGWPLLTLPNRLLTRRAVPELVNSEVTPQRVVQEGLTVLRDAESRQTQLQALRQVQSLLGPPGAIERVADLAEELLELRGAARHTPRELATTHE